MRPKYLVATGIIIAIALGIFYAGYSSVLNKDSSSIRAITSNTKIDTFSARTLTGEDFVALSDSIVVYEVFASWCIPCKKSVPEVLAFAKNNPDIPVIGIAYRDVDFEIKKFQDEYGSFSQVIMGNGSVEDAFGIKSVPQTLIVSDGIILYRIFGTSTQEDLEELLTLVERKTS